MDSLYDMHSTHSQWADQNADSLDLYIRACCSAYSYLQYSLIYSPLFICRNTHSEFDRFEEFLSDLKTNRLMLDNGRRFCERLQAHFALTSVCFFVMKDNMNMHPLVGVGEAMDDHFVLKTDERYCTEKE